MERDTYLGRELSLLLSDIPIHADHPSDASGFSAPELKPFKDHSGSICSVWDGPLESVDDALVVLAVRELVRRRVRLVRHLTLLARLDRREREQVGLLE